MKNMEQKLIDIKVHIIIELQYPSTEQKYPSSTVTIAGKREVLLKKTDNDNYILPTKTLENGETIDEAIKLLTCNSGLDLNHDDRIPASVTHNYDFSESIGECINSIDLFVYIGIAINDTEEGEVVKKLVGNKYSWKIKDLIDLETFANDADTFMIEGLQHESTKI